MLRKRAEDTTRFTCAANQGKPGIAAKSVANPEPRMLVAACKGSAVPA